MTQFKHASNKTRYVKANGLRLAYESFGGRHRPAVILVSGMSTQLTAWPEELCLQLAGQGFHVVRFDNRDIGLSEKIRGQSLQEATMLRLMLRQMPAYRISASLHERLPLPHITHPSHFVPLRAPYTLRDMSADLIGLMDALGIGKAHIVGASMGGMIAQHCAIGFPGRLLSMVSIMSTSGAAHLPGPTLRMQAHFLQPQRGGEKAAIERAVRTLRLVSGRRYQDSDELLRRRVQCSHQRSYYPQGGLRHMAAIASSRYWAGDLRDVRLPTLVLHGSDDPLVRPVCGRHVARRVPGARFELIDGMGHDLPHALVNRLLQSLVPHLRATSA